MPSARANPPADRFFFRPEPRRLSSLFLVLLLGVAAAASPAQAQSERSGGVFYGKFGGGISDYTGDLPFQTATHFADLREFTDGTGAPLIISGELGYQLSPQFSLALGFQMGNHPLLGLNNTIISDSRLLTGQVLGRYTFGAEAWTVAPYLDGGAAITFGGNPEAIGYGPAVGGGIDIKLTSAASLFLESRFNLSFPDDAVDGADSVPDQFDVVGQLIGVGLRVNLTGAPALPTIPSPEPGVPPAIRSLDGPETIQVDSSATFTATVNEEAERPLSYRWEFGDGETASGSTVTHAYDQTGTYAVTFTASNEVGEVSRSLEVTVTSPGQPPRVIALDGPTDVLTDEPATFTAQVNEEADRPRSYHWNFGDGETASGLTASHTYDFAGTYEVTFTASNEAGAVSRSFTVNVARARPLPARIASIRARPNPAHEGVPVRFRSVVQGAGPLTYEWHFGDGSTATGPSPIHTYEEPGQYTVRLEVSNEYGEDSNTLTIRVY